MNLKFFISIVISIILQIVTFQIEDCLILHIIPFAIGFSGGSMVLVAGYYIVSTLLLAMFIRLLIKLIGLMTSRD